MSAFQQQYNVGAQGTTVIHLVTVEGGVERIACMPGLREFHMTPQHPAFLRSNDVRAVTCKQCLRGGK